MNPADFEVVLLAAGCSRRLAHLTRDVPKSFLRAGELRLIDRTLDSLDMMGFERVTAIVGYRSEVFRKELGHRVGRLRLRYVEAPDYETTGHAWSFFQARDLLRGEGRPVFLVHADVLADPRMYEAVFEAPGTDVIGTDERFVSKTGDEVLVCGSREGVSAIRKIGERPADVLGEVVGVNRWSSAFVLALLDYMESFFATRGRDWNWEPVIDSWLANAGPTLQPAFTGGLPWVNVNYEEDLAEADRIARELERA